MVKTKSKDELLHVCVQDLYAGRTLAATKLPTVASAAGEGLCALVQAMQQQYAEEAAQFERTGYDLDGPENLWMAGIMDDAERDTRTIARGLLLDIAIIGAVRKALAADAVSLETAVVVAHSLGEESLGNLLRSMRERGHEADLRLRQRLHEIG